jgi:DNA-binding NarL/FixJ family response regulator
MSTNTSPDAIRIVLVDDHLVVRAGLKALLGGVPDIRIVGEAANGQEGFELIQRVTPDVAVLDLDMPVMDGRTLLEHLAALLEAGTAGYLIKTAADRELVDAIRVVAAGETYVQPAAARALATLRAQQAKHHAERARYRALSDRERDVLVLVASGHSASAIGERLFISPKTVETYKQRVAEKLGLHHRPDYVQFCLQLDLLRALP